LIESIDARGALGCLWKPLMGELCLESDLPQLRGGAVMRDRGALEARVTVDGESESEPLA
jgi:hypothetical protein